MVAGVFMSSTLSGALSSTAVEAVAIEEADDVRAPSESGLGTHSVLASASSSADELELCVESVTLAEHSRVEWYSLRSDRVEGGRNSLVVAVPHVCHRSTRTVVDTVEAPVRVRSRLKGRAEHTSQCLVQRASTTKVNSQRPVRVRDRHETIVVLVILVPRNQSRLASVRTVIDTVQAPMRKGVRLESRAVHPGQRPIDCTTTTSHHSQRSVRVRYIRETCRSYVVSSRSSNECSSVA
jgi:hypothetical protein